MGDSKKREREKRERRVCERRKGGRKRRSNEEKKNGKTKFSSLTSAGSSTSTTLPSLSVAVSLTNGKDDAGGKPPWRPMTGGGPAGEAVESLLPLGDRALSAAAEAVTSSRNPAMRRALPSVENIASKSSGKEGTSRASSSSLLFCMLRQHPPAASAVTSVRGGRSFDAPAVRSKKKKRKNFERNKRRSM